VKPSTIVREWPLSGAARVKPRPWSELWRYRELLRNLVLKDLKLKYRGSWLGALWSLIHPLLLIAVYWVAFEYILSFRVNRFPLLLLIGIFHWQTFHQALRAASRAILSHSSLITEAVFPRMILPLAVVSSAFIQLSFALILLIPALFLFQAPLSWTLLLYTPAVALHIVFTIGVALGLSALTVFYRDIEHLFDVALRALFWVTPVVYPFSIVPDGLARILQFNPLVPFMRTYQDLLYGGLMPDGTRWLVMAGWAVLALALGYALFRRYEPRFAEEV
jgi:lipopolysaccharide transport system permease protein